MIFIFYFFVGIFVGFVLFRVFFVPVFWFFLCCCFIRVPVFFDCGSFLVSFRFCYSFLLLGMCIFLFFISSWVFLWGLCYSGCFLCLFFSFFYFVDSFVCFVFFGCGSVFGYPFVFVILFYCWV